MTRIETLTRAAVAGSTTLDLDARTVEVTFATETPVRRHSWETGAYDEILDCTPAAIDAGRMSSMSLLDSHRTGSLADRIGTVVPGSLKFDRGSVSCTIKLSRTEKADALLTDLADGHALPVSVGYRIHVEERTEGQNGGVATVKATRWEPLEISIVTIPADAGAKTRSLEEGNTQMTTTQTRSNEQRTETLTERRRISDIRAIGRTSGATGEVIDTAIDDGTSADAFRAAVWDQMVERQNQTPIFSHRSVDDDGSRNQNMREAMSDALLTRVNPAHQPKADAREFVGLSLAELARRTLERTGHSTHGLSAGSVIERALHTTSDFPLIISSVGEQTLLSAYHAAPSALKLVAKRSSVSDFKPKTGVRLSGFSDLEKVNEHGEFRSGTFSESAESYKVETYGKIFGMTRQMLVNDQLGAFADVATKLGQKASQFEASFLANLLTANPKMGDGKTLFHADHGNLAAGSDLTVAGLTAARTAFRRQKDETGALIGVAPRYLIVPPELETKAEQLLAEVQAITVDTVNPFGGKLLLVVEPRLTSSKRWYLSAAPNEIGGLEFAYLNGEEGPQFLEQYGFRIDGVEIRVRLDFGAGFMDWRGWYTNPGV